LPKPNPVYNFQLTENTVVAGETSGVFADEIPLGAAYHPPPELKYTTAEEQALFLSF
jgi:hypothetical protein